MTIRLHKEIDLAVQQIQHCGAVMRAYASENKVTFEDATPKERAETLDAIEESLDDVLYEIRAGTWDTACERVGDLLRDQPWMGPLLVEPLYRCQRWAALGDNSSEAFFALMFEEVFEVA